MQQGINASEPLSVVTKSLLTSSMVEELQDLSQEMAVTLDNLKSTLSPILCIPDTTSGGTQPTPPPSGSKLGQALYGLKCEFTRYLIEMDRLREMIDL